MELSHSKIEEKTTGAGDTRKNPKDQSLQKVTVRKANPNVGRRRFLFPFACRETQERKPPSVSIKPRLPKHKTLSLSLSIWGLLLIYFWLLFYTKILVFKCFAEPTILVISHLDIKPLNENEHTSLSLSFYKKISHTLSLSLSSSLFMGERGLGKVCMLLSCARCPAAISGDILAALNCERR